MLRLERLVLTDFRGYAALTWRPAERIAVLFGPNGSGKTNLLEAVSLLVPGRGLRGARPADLPRLGGPGTWAVAGRFQSAFGVSDIGTGTRAETTGDRRVFRLDGRTPRSQAEIAERAAMIWLTPQMDRLFQEGLSGRRRFLDRLVWALEPNHARELHAHDTAMQGRSRLLAGGQGLGRAPAEGEEVGRSQAGEQNYGRRRAGGRVDAAWLAGLEDSMARHAVAATASRMALVRRLNAEADGGQAGGAQADGAFPTARISLGCPIAERLEREPALAVEDWLRQALAANRERDARTGMTGLGAHRCDMALSDARTGMPAGASSTGEQKALLVGLILAHAAQMTAVRGFAPLLLLDEPAVHLDPARRTALFRRLAALPAQTLLTGTDAETFEPLRGEAAFLRVGEGRLEPVG